MVSIFAERLLSFGGVGAVVMQSARVVFVLSLYSVLSLISIVAVASCFNNNRRIRKKKDSTQVILSTTRDIVLFIGLFIVPALRGFFDKFNDFVLLAAD
jgi:hypothetical protein